jgi:hypothetical protein
MKKKRHRHEEIARILEAGASRNLSLVEGCRARGVHPQTDYGWKKKFGGISGDGHKRLRQLEKENARLKRA